MSFKTFQSSLSISYTFVSLSSSPSCYISSSVFLHLFPYFFLSFLSDTKFATKIIDANLLQNEVVTKRRKKISFRSFNQRLFLLSKSDEGSRQMEKKICFLTLAVSKILIRNRLFWAVKELLVNLGFLSKWLQNVLKR